MLKKAIFIGLACLSANSYSGSVLGTQIVELEFAKSQENWVLIKASGEKLDCQRTGGWHFSLKTDTDYGKQMLSVVLAAFAAGKTIDLKGYQTPVCGYADLEVLDKINVHR